MGHRVPWRANRTCDRCGREFKPPLKSSRFCSHPCFAASHRSDPEVAFWKRVDKDGPTPTTRPHLGPCWVWRGAKARNGRGHFTPHKGEPTVVAARYAYASRIGPIPHGLFVCHRCDNPSCVRPDHLFAATQSDNLMDASRKGRLNVGTRNHNAVLTDDIVAEIRSLHARQKESMRSMARRLGVSRTSIKQALSRETWRHVS